MADATLMETLHAQQELLQKLYTELDMEREAAATAASESLSMILRLQGEKSAVEMEASQYKRIAEEKMVHAEETLETFRDLIYQKEMQIASLEFQTQAYRFKLISLGCSDVSGNEITYPGNMLVKRGCSLPPNFLQTSTDCEVSGGSSVKEQDLCHVKTEDFSSYWEQITRLNELVKQLSNSRDLSDSGNKLNEMSRSCSLHSQASKDPATPAKVHDIFEVPQTANDGEFANLPESKDKGKLSPEDEFYPVTPDAIKAVISDDTEKNHWDQRINMSLDMDSTLPKPRDGLAIEHLYCKRPDVTDFELQQLNRRLKRLEDERIMARQEIKVENDDEKLLLLKAIKDQLNSIEDGMKRWRHKKPPPKKDVDLTSLTEAMLHFWL